MQYENLLDILFQCKTERDNFLGICKFLDLISPDTLEVRVKSEKQEGWFVLVDEVIPPLIGYCQRMTLKPVRVCPDCL